MRRVRLVLSLVVALSGVGCGGDGGGDGTDDALVTGRVVSLDADLSRYCVSPDRGVTETCVDVPDPEAVEGVDVGECVTTSRDLTLAGAKVEVVDEAACAAGDLGDAGDDG
jgi:hypothetical protein